MRGEVERMCYRVKNGRVIAGVGCEHVHFPFVDCFTPLAVVFEHLLERDAIGERELLDKEVLVTTDGLDFVRRVARAAPAGGPIIECLVEFIDIGVRGLGAPLDCVDDGGEALDSVLVAADGGGDEGSRKGD